MNVPQAIADIKLFRQSHVDWAEYFERYPATEAAYVKTGQWNNAQEHRRIVLAYDNVLEILNAIDLSPPAG